MMKRLRITVEGTAYDVTVEEMDQPGTPAPAPITAAAPPPAPAPTPAVAPALIANASTAPVGPGAVACPLAGTVVSVDVAVGQVVTQGQTLLVLEAMKMNTPIGAPQAGTVATVSVTPGATVTEGQVLVTLS
ncbi:MAG: biotin/lipoyl-binding protein [Rhodospirillum sp.]|nr:biotin/lipoyl-binding protein [Rhodospirillum sp.]MCF8489872.1 biotin/lipoyl-binding protein [Rhodospirillum sp.]MCF8499435.1 biotin/lipoyl-binding protein [Rhodospirillum sp.]